MEEIIKDWQALIGFGITIAIFVWKVPSKNDLKDVRSEIRDVRSEMKDVRSEMKELRTEMKELRTELKSDNVVLAQKVDTLNQNFIDHLNLHVTGKQKTPD